jgi:hypothetical protein
MLLTFWQFSYTNTVPIFDVGGPEQIRTGIAPALSATRIRSASPVELLLPSLHRLLEAHLG